MTVEACFPYLRVHDGAAAIAFYVQVFGATERFRLLDPENGRVGHAELVLAPGVELMLSDAYPEMGLNPPAGPQGSSLHLHVTNCDAVIERALAAGATLVRAAGDQFYGERTGSFRDPFGHTWMVGHELEAMEPAEMQRRWNAMMAG